VQRLCFYKIGNSETGPKINHSGFSKWRRVLELGRIHEKREKLEKLEKCKILVHPFFQAKIGLEKKFTRKTRKTRNSTNRNVMKVGHSAKCVCSSRFGDMALKAFSQIILHTCVWEIVEYTSKKWGPDINPP
jgi:hypothetical protein